MHIHSTGDVLIDRYRVSKFLAEGGMQEVYRVRDLMFDRPVALKVPKSNSAARRFHRSAKMSARVTHPNVAKTLDYFEAENRFYLVEELVHGDDLRHRLANEFEVMDPYLAARIFHQLCKGVAASHRANVFHRDLKPSNIMVSNDPHVSEVKITDFGIAKMAEEEFNDVISHGGDASITGSKTVLGAVPYMAPEMFDNPKKASKPADVWALGAILYHLCVGSPPFGTGLTAIKRIVQGELPDRPPILSRGSCSPKLSDELWGQMTACFQMDPTNRPSADKLVENCSRLCYATATRRLGTIRNYGGGSGDWGYISPNGEGDHIFFHKNCFHGAEKPKAGHLVNFACYPGAPRERAFPVLLLRQEDSRKAA